MALTPALLRLDLKCGRGSISPGEKCSKGAARQVHRVSRGLEQGTNEQLEYHRAVLSMELIDRYPHDIVTPEDRASLQKWMSKQPEYAEIEAVTNILNKRQKRSDAMGRRCGQGYVAAGKKCRQGGAFPTRTAIAAGIGAAGLTAGAIALYMSSRHGKGPVPPLGIRGSDRPQLPGGPGRLPGGSTPPSPRALPGDRTTRVLGGDRTPLLPGAPSPKGLLRAAPPRRSKTQRMRDNTAAAIREAEAAVAQTAREEVRRIGQIGNTMAQTGEATGMATKTTLRELRLRAEALRRRYEPGYRATPAPRARPQSQLPEGGSSAFQPPFAPPTRSPSESVPIDPRTGQPQRRRARGFGRTDALTPASLLHL